jgi:Rrf2 family protein
VRVTAKVDYAVRASVELARAVTDEDVRTTRVKGQQIATAQGIPPKFLENILADLKRSGLVGSVRGADGGYWLNRRPEKVSVADIIRAVEGPLADVRGEPPEELAYPGDLDSLQRVWIALRSNLRAILEHVTLADLVAGKLDPDVDRLADTPDAWERR